MTNGSNVKQYLDKASRAVPNIVIPKLENGSLVLRNRLYETFYEIDDTEIYRRLNPQEAIPYRAIHKKLTSSTDKIDELFARESVQRDRRRVLPFSKVFESGFGACLEKAILIQLSAQKRNDSFLVNGVLLKGESGYDMWAHAYNVLFVNDQIPCLIDAENPLIDEAGNKIIPYIVPIIGINSSGEFQVPAALRQNRTYALT